jgi:hypothetical protein
MPEEVASLFLNLDSCSPPGATAFFIAHQSKKFEVAGKFVISGDFAWYDGQKM